MAHLSCVADSQIEQINYSVQEKRFLSFFLLCFCFLFFFYSWTNATFFKIDILVFVVSRCQRTYHFKRSWLQCLFPIGQLQIGGSGGDGDGGVAGYK